MAARTLVDAGCKVLLETTGITKKRERERREERERERRERGEEK